MNLTRSRTKVKAGRSGVSQAKPAGCMTAVAKMSESDIRELAYEFFKARGCIHGNDLGDWFLAEKTIAEKVRENG